MTPEQAIEIVRKRFPFPQYMELKDAKYLHISGTVCKYLSAGASIFDFGSGPGEVTAILQVLGFNCSACDDLQDYWLHENGKIKNIIDFYNQFNIEFHYMKDDCFDINYSAKTYDMVMLHDVIEHLHDSPRDLLNDLVAALRPGGYLFISVPNLVNIKKRIDVLWGRTNLGDYDFFYWYPGAWRGHVREYTKDDLIKLCNNLNMEILEISSCHFMAARRLKKYPKYVKIMYRMLTGIFPGWRDTWSIIGKKPNDWVPRKSLPEPELQKIYGKQFD